MDNNELDTTSGNGKRLDVHCEASSIAFSTSNESTSSSSKVYSSCGLLLSPIKEQSCNDSNLDLSGLETELNESQDSINCSNQPKLINDQNVKRHIDTHITESDSSSSLNEDDTSHHSPSPKSEDILSKASSLSRFFSEAMTHLVAGVRHFTMEIRSCLGEPSGDDSVAVHTSNLMTAEAALEVINSLRMTRSEEDKIPTQKLSLWLLEEVEQGGLCASVLPFAHLRETQLGEENIATHLESAYAILNLLSTVAEAKQTRKMCANDADPLLMCLLSFMSATLTLFALVIHISPLRHELQERFEVAFTKILLEINPGVSSKSEATKGDHPLCSLLNSIYHSLEVIEEQATSIKTDSMGVSYERIRKLVKCHALLLKMEIQLLLPAPRLDGYSKENRLRPGFLFHEVETQLHFLTNLASTEREVNEANDLNLYWLMVAIALLSDSKTRYNRVTLINQLRMMLDTCLADQNVQLHDDFLEIVSSELSGQKVDYSLLFPVLLESQLQRKNLNGGSFGTDSQVDYWLHIFYKKGFTNQQIARVLAIAFEEGKDAQNPEDKKAIIDSLLNDLEQREVFLDLEKEGECTLINTKDVTIPPAGWMSIVQICLEERICLLDSASDAKIMDKSTIEVDSVLSGHCLAFAANLPLLFSAIIGIAGEGVFTLDFDSFDRHSLASSSTRALSRIKTIPSCTVPKELLAMDWARLGRSTITNSELWLNSTNPKVTFYKAWESLKQLNLSFGEGKLNDFLGGSLESLCEKKQRSNSCSSSTSAYAIMFQEFQNLLLIQREVYSASNTTLLPCDEPPSWRVEDTLQGIWSHSQSCKVCEKVCASKEFTDVESSILLMAELLEELWINPDSDKSNSCKDNYWSIVEHTLQKIDEMYQWVSKNVIGKADQVCCTGSGCT